MCAQSFTRSRYASWYSDHLAASRLIEPLQTSSSFRQSVSCPAIYLLLFETSFGGRRDLANCWLAENRVLTIRRVVGPQRNAASAQDFQEGPVCGAPVVSFDLCEHVLADSVVGTVKAFSSPRGSTAAPERLIGQEVKIYMDSHQPPLPGGSRPWRNICFSEHYRPSQSERMRFLSRNGDGSRFRRRALLMPCGFTVPSLSEHVALPGFGLRARPMMGSGYGCEKAWDVGWSVAHARLHDDV